MMRLDYFNIFMGNALSFNLWNFLANFVGTLFTIMVIVAGKDKLTRAREDSANEANQEAAKAFATLNDGLKEMLNKKQEIIQKDEEILKKKDEYIAQLETVINTNRTMLRKEEIEILKKNKFSQIPISS